MDVRYLSVAFLLVFLPTVAAAESSLGTCEADRGEPQPYIRRVTVQEKQIVLLGRGLNPDLLVFVDGFLVNATSPGTNELRFPVKAYPGSKVLPAMVSLQVESRDGTKSSNTCSVKYPGDFPLLIGAATGLSNREGEPVAMALGFLGLPGSVQQSTPTDHADGKPMGAGARLLRRMFLVVGATKVAKSEGPGWTLGAAVRLGDIKFLYACRFNGSDYPRHIFGVAGTIKVADIVH